MYDRKSQPSAGACQVSGIGAVTGCGAGSAVVSWQPSAGAGSYVTELEAAASGHVTSCATNHTKCELSSVQCGEEYNVTVKAVGGTCNSTARLAGYLLTGTSHSPEAFMVVFAITRETCIIQIFFKFFTPIRALCSWESLHQLQCERCHGDVESSQRGQLLLCAGCDQSGFNSHLQHKSHRLFGQWPTVWSELQCDCHRAQPGLQQHCGV